MEAKKLYLENGKPIKAHLCGKCNRIWESPESAERCCVCSYCGEYCSWVKGGTTHSECQRKHFDKMEAERLEKATLVPDYAGPFLFDDRVYMDIADLLDSIEPDELPEFGFCTHYQAPHIDVQNVMENAGEMHEDWEPNGEAELAEAIAVWNDANKDNGTYWEDQKRKWSKAAILTADSNVSEHSEIRSENE